LTRWVLVKGTLGVIGLAVGLAGMALDHRPLVWVAIGFLGAAFLLRFLERRQVTPGGDDA
jgi:hypothetical protein